MGVCISTHPPLGEASQMTVMLGTSLQVQQNINNRVRGSCTLLPTSWWHPWPVLTSWFTASVSGKCITFSWLLSIIYSFSLLYTGANDAGLEDLVSALTCVGGCQIAVNQTWVFINFLLFLIPTLVMITVYSKIFLIAKQQAQNIEKMSKQTARASESYKDRVTKRERKAAKTLGIAVAAFLLSWLPYFIDSIIDAFLGFITPTYVYEILVWIVYYNSAMNPLIYAFFYSWFRKAIKLIVSGKILRENSSTTNLFPE